MKMKRIVAIVMALSLMLALVSCGKKETNVSENGKMTITWLGYPNNQSAEEGTDAELLLEEKFGVEIKPIFYANQNYNDKKTMLLASGDIPDLIYELDPSHVAADADQGFLAKVDYETIAKHAPTVYGILKEEAPQAFMYSYADGDNYGVPNISFFNEGGRVGWWRLDWLKNVGIDKVPETIDEMYDALYKFTKNDPDGNGKNDTYGMSGDIVNWHTMFSEVFGAYGVIPFNWMEQDGKVVYGGFADGVTDAIDTLAKWYSEGLIHPDFKSDNVFGNGKERFTSGSVGYINNHGGYMEPGKPWGLGLTTVEINPKAEIACAKYVKGPEGHSGTQCWGLPCHIISFGAHLEDDEAKLIKILEIFEGTINDSEFLHKVKMGDEGVNWEYVDKEAKFKGGFNWLEPYNDSAQRSKYCIDSTFAAPTFFVPTTPSRDEYNAHVGTGQENWNIENDRVANGHADIFSKPDVLPSAAKYFENLRTQQINIMVRAIQGEITSAEYIEQFKALWEKNGGLKLQEEADGMGATMNKVIKKVTSY